MSTAVKPCSACHEDKPQDDYSKKAWKARQIRRCRDCTTADRPVVPRPQPPPPPSIEADFSRCAIDDDLGAQGLCPIARGSAVTLDGLSRMDLNGLTGDVVSGPTGSERRYGVIIDGQGRPVAIKQVNLVLVDDGVGRPSALDAIRHSPSLATEEYCDDFCKKLVLVVLPDLQRSDNQLLPFDSDIARGHPSFGPWPRQATVRLVEVRMDAVCHHCVLEWRAQDGGWRVFQSNVNNFTAGAWASRNGAALHMTNPLGQQGFTDGGEVHERFGGGRVLDDAGISEFWRRLLHLRRVSDEVVADVLVPQCPVDLSWPMPPHDDPTLEAWRIKMGTVANWAADWCNKGESLGCTGVPLPDSFDIYVGRDRLFSVPLAKHMALSEAYVAITGDRLSQFVYLRLLNYINYANRGFPAPDYEVSGKVTCEGFVFKAISAGSTPM